MIRLPLVLAAAILLIATACGGDGGADVGDVDALALLQTSAAAMDAVESFHFEVEHEGGVTEIVRGLGMSRAEGDVVGDDRMRLQVEARFAMTNVEVGIVVLPGQSFLSNPITGRWEEEEIDISDLFDPAAGVTGIMREVTTAEAVDREDIDGREMVVLEATVDSTHLEPFVSNAEPGQPVLCRVWIAVDDSLVYRLEARGAVAPADSEGMVRRINLSAFNEPVEITAPD